MGRDIASQANVELVIRDSLPAHLDELHKEREKLIARLVKLNERIALCETLSQVAPSPEPEGLTE